LTNVLLVRHGTHSLLGKEIVGRKPGVHLSEQGKEESEAVAQRLAHLGVNHIYSSPLERARETAEPLARITGLSVQIVEDLQEVDFGDWSGLSLEALGKQELWQRFNAYRTGTRIPGGEIISEVQDRAAAFVNSLASLHAGETVALFSHADTIKAALAYFLGSPLDLFLRLEISPASVSGIRLHEYNPQILFINHCGALRLP
jgi:probable phosphoglycerate mutase